jgi:hypothetical protein
VVRIRYLLKENRNLASISSRDESKKLYNVNKGMHMKLKRREYITAHWGMAIRSMRTKKKVSKQKEEKSA